MINKTLVILKPDAVKRGLIGEIISRFEKRGLIIDKMEMKTLSEESILEHYFHMIDRPKIFKEIESYMKSGPVAILSVSDKDNSENVISIVRKMVGSTNPVEAESGTIRGDFATSIEENIIHASDSLENSEREHIIHFN